MDAQGRLGRSLAVLFVKAGAMLEEGAPSTNDKPVDRSHGMTGQKELTAMPMRGQASDRSTLATPPVKR
jgi:hypothetical protein